MPYLDGGGAELLRGGEDRSPGTLGLTLHRGRGLLPLREKRKGLVFHRGKSGSHVLGEKVTRPRKKAHRLR